MKRQTRRLALLLALCLLLSLLFPAALATEESESNNVYTDATPVGTDGFSAVGKLNEGTDLDWYKFKVSRFGEMAFSFSATEPWPVFDAWEAFLYADDGTTIITHFDRVPISSTSNHEIYIHNSKVKTLNTVSLKPGTYYLFVRSRFIVDWYTEILKSTYTLSGKFTAVNCQHTGGTKVETITASTCSKAGSRRVICRVCGEYLGTEASPMPAHRSDGKYVVVRASTCANAGLEAQHCTVCGQECGSRYLTRLSHTPGPWVTTREPTCTTSGMEYKYCSVCGESTTSSGIAKLKHTPGPFVVKEEASCTSSGLQNQYCTVCNVQLAFSILPMTAHAFDDWTVTVQPTGNTDGAKFRTCSLCNKTENVKIPADPSLGVAITGWEGAGSDYISVPPIELEEIVIPLIHVENHPLQDTGEGRTPTCTEGGTVVSICTVCGEGQKTTQYLSALGHDFEPWTVKTEAACGVEGVEVQRCRTCGLEETRTLPALAHDFGSWFLKAPAQCEIQGAEARTCLICAKEETKPIPALVHDIVTKSELEEDREIYTDVCTICGEVLDKEIVVIASVPKLEENQTEVTFANATEPTVITLKPLPFADVQTWDWFHPSLVTAYSLDLMVGSSATQFSPLSNMTLAEAVTMASRARNAYYGGVNADFSPSAVWYQTYVDYALKHDILQPDDFDDYTRTATRAEMAYVFSRALPAKGLAPINTVSSLPDVTSQAKYGDEIFTLYRAGVLTGGDRSGTFHPDEPISRAEAAAIIVRITLSSARQSISL